MLVCFFDVLSSRCEDEERTKRIYHHKTYLSLVCHCVKFEPQGKGMLMPEKVSESTMGLVGTFSTSKAVDAPSKAIEIGRQGEGKTISTVLHEAEGRRVSHRSIDTE